MKQAVLKNGVSYRWGFTVSETEILFLRPFFLLHKIEWPLYCSHAGIMCVSFYALCK